MDSKARWRERNREKERERVRRYHAANPHKVRARTLRRTYGITSADYARMVAFQMGRCKACGGLPTGKRARLFVDHDHLTGKVCGLLCNGCNVAAGMLTDSPERCRQLAEYLVRTRTTSTT